MPDNLPWRAINDYLTEIGAEQTKDRFLSTVLSALPRLVPFDVEGGVFQVMGRCLHVVGASEERIRMYTDYYQYRQPFFEETGAPIPPADLLGAQITDWSGRYIHTEMVTDFIVPGGIRKTLTSMLPGNRFLIAVHRSRLALDFTDLDRSIMTVVSPHIRNFSSIWEKLGNQSTPAVEVVVDSFPALSHREAEIAALLCDGLSTGEIATRLFISRRTVEAHLAHIYDKLDVRTRGSPKKLIVSGIGQSQS